MGSETSRHTSTASCATGDRSFLLKLWMKLGGSVMTGMNTYSVNINNDNVNNNNKSNDNNNHDNDNNNNNNNNDDK